MLEDAFDMKEALKEAQNAFDEGEVPIGAVVVFEGEIISRGHNEREGCKNALRHAEITALERACQVRGGWRLFGCTLYVTLEPCPMCMGALINARVDRVVFGARDPKAGALGSVLNLNSFPFNHHLSWEEGVMKEECQEMLKRFFRSLRRR